MKCANCGAEIRVGCVYCPVCGKEAQIVSDYNILEDDYLDSLLQEGEKPSVPSKSKQKEKAAKPKQEKPTGKKSKKSLYIVIFILLFVAAFALIGGILFAKSLSYEGRMEKAEDAYEKKAYEKAISYAKQALEKKKEDALAYAVIGKSYYQNKEDEAAKAYLEKAVEKQQKDKEVYRFLIDLYDKDSDYEAIGDLYDEIKDSSIQKLFRDYIVEAPEVEPEAGSYGEYPTITINSKDGADILYTLDGSSPKEDGMFYQEPFPIEKEGKYTLRAVCVDARGIYSKEVKVKYEIDLDVPDLPTASPASGTYTQPIKITIDVPVGCRAYYAWNANPGEQSTQYTEPFDMIEGNNVLSIILINESGQTSGVQKYNYVYMP